jgi:hypothetical protein
LRFGCITKATLGGGAGGAVVAAPIYLASNTDGGMEALHGIMQLKAVNSVHFGTIDPAIPSVPFQIGGDAPAHSGDAVMVIEGFDRATLSASLADVDAQLRQAGLIDASPPWTSYRLGYAVARAELPDVVVIGR